MTDLVNALHDISDSLDNIGSGSGSSFSPDITNPQDGQTLIYDATADKWVNGAGGGGTLLVTITEQADTPSPGYITYTMNKTWQEIHDAIVSGVMPVFYGYYVDEYLENWYIAVIEARYEYGEYCARDPIMDRIYRTDSANGYPSYVYEPVG